MTLGFCNPSQLYCLQEQIACQKQHVRAAKTWLNKSGTAAEEVLHTQLAHMHTLQQSLALSGPCFTQGLALKPAASATASMTCLSQQLLLIATTFGVCEILCSCMPVFAALRTVTGLMPLHPSVWFQLTCVRPNTTKFPEAIRRLFVPVHALCCKPASSYARSHQATAAHRLMSVLQP